MYVRADGVGLNSPEDRACCRPWIFGSALLTQGSGWDENSLEGEGWWGIPQRLSPDRKRGTRSSTAQLAGSVGSNLTDVWNSGSCE
jgi:hypothetical protein